ncbi:hypothetical protein CB1_002337051 [Camelus ferus]|nr:hypothetical protein CB1_002337051 [Camelus ferus]
MAVLLLLPVLATACVFSVGVGLWVVCSHFLTADIPAAIGHPVKLRVFHCLLQLLVTWGMIFEKLRLCSMPQFVRFVHDLMPLKKYPDLEIKDLQFGTIPVRLYQPKASSNALRPGILFYHGGGAVLGSLSKCPSRRPHTRSMTASEQSWVDTSFQQEATPLSSPPGLKAPTVTREHQGS